VTPARPSRKSAIIPFKSILFNFGRSIFHFLR
jgi:hypothetical protein